MSAAENWKDAFVNWPSSIPRKGIVINEQNETSPFKAFMVKGDMLLLERSNPDSLGARFILMPFESVSSVRFVDPLKESIFTSAGFVGKLSQT
jgi:hypothetical protein